LIEWVWWVGSIHAPNQLGPSGGNWCMTRQAF